MSKTVIQVENLSKLYQLGEFSTGTLGRDLQRWWAGVRGREDPFSKIGETNDRSTKGTSDYVWALRDIAFEVKQGEILGIIGRNGAGKSTLLKILSRVTKPTTGRIRVRGRMASLLEVGTGFHPELTGRENIFLNGAILGMRKDEIRRKLDEIVDFSGVERYLDTPVKRYSSGMYVRLAFAVAAHLEPEILIVDEVLAVGDAEFQKKCLGKMQDVSEREGRTVLFVSHNMSAMRALCQRALIMEVGQITRQGTVEDMVHHYLQAVSRPTLSREWTAHDRPVYAGLHLLSVYIENNAAPFDDILTTDTPFTVKLEYRIVEEGSILGFTLSFWNDMDEIIFQSINNHERNYFGKPLSMGTYVTDCQIPRHFLNQGKYAISLNIFSQGYTNPMLIKNVLSISIEDGKEVRGDYFGGLAGYMRPKLTWTTQAT
jgi:lipopolysaccharide transport system ATP-binding protein